MTVTTRAARILVHTVMGAVDNTKNCVATVYHHVPSRRLRTVDDTDLINVALANKHSAGVHNKTTPHAIANSATHIQIQTSAARALAPIIIVGTVGTNRGVLKHPSSAIITQ